MINITRNIRLRLPRMANFLQDVEGHTHAVVDLTREEAQAVATAMSEEFMLHWERLQQLKGVTNRG